jgi:outer membrane protein assembly factor BamB
MNERLAALALASWVSICAPSCASEGPSTAGLEPDQHGTAATAAVPVDAPDWPQWAGPYGDFHTDSRDLAVSWPPEGPTRIWERPLGGGYSAITARGGRLYTLYRDGDQDVVVALRASTGETLWEHRYPGKTHPGNQLEFGSGPNAAPLVLEDRVVTLGYGGMLLCLDATSGEPLWRHDLIGDLAGEVLEFGYSASPVLIEDRIVVLVGGDRQAAVAFDPLDGSVVWRSEPRGISYATPIAIDLDGQRQIVFFSAEEIIGIDAATGRHLWSHPCVNRYRNNATPPHWHPRLRLLWVATQLDGGTRVLRLHRLGDAVEVEEVWSSSRISLHFWNSVRVEDHVYASIGGQAAIFAAIDMRTGEIAWRERGFSKINGIYADDKLVFLDEKGHLGVARVAPEGFELLAQTRLTEHKTWTVPTLVGTRLFVRDESRILALELGDPQKLQ